MLVIQLYSSLKKLAFSLTEARSILCVDAIHVLQHGDVRLAVGQCRDHTPESLD